MLHHHIETHSVITLLGTSPKNTRNCVFIWFCRPSSRAVMILVSVRRSRPDTNSTPCPYHIETHYATLWTWTLSNVFLYGWFWVPVIRAKYTVLIPCYSHYHLRVVLRDTLRLVYSSNTDYFAVRLFICWQSVPYRNTLGDVLKVPLDDPKSLCFRMCFYIIEKHTQSRLAPSHAYNR